MDTYEIQVELPGGNSMFMLVASFNANEAKLLARDMLLDLQKEGAPFVRRAVEESTVYVVSCQRLTTGE